MQKLREKNLNKFKFLSDFKDIVYLLLFQKILFSSKILYIKL